MNEQLIRHMLTPCRYVSKLLCGCFTVWLLFSRSVSLWHKFNVCCCFCAAVYWLVVWLQRSSLSKPERDSLTRSVSCSIKNIMFNLQIFQTAPHILQQMALSLWKVTDCHKSHHAKYFYIFLHIYHTQTGRYNLLPSAKWREEDTRLDPTAKKKTSKPKPSHHTTQNTQTHRLFHINHNIKQTMCSFHKASSSFTGKSNAAGASEQTKQTKASERTLDLIQHLCNDSQWSLDLLVVLARPSVHVNQRQWTHHEPHKEQPSSANDRRSLRFTQCICACE